MAQINFPSKFAEEHGGKNWTKAELKEKRETEVVLNNNNIQPSSFLPDYLHDRFYWFVNEFKDMGILNNVDGDALSRYVMADYNYWKINDELEKMEVTEDGYSRLNNVQNRLHTQALQLSKELGLTMAARGKLKREQEEDKEEQSDEEKLFGKALGL